MSSFSCQGWNLSWVRLVFIKDWRVVSYKSRLILPIPCNLVKNPQGMQTHLLTYLDLFLSHAHTIWHLRFISNQDLIEKYSRTMFIFSHKSLNNKNVTNIYPIDNYCAVFFFFIFVNTIQTCLQIVSKKGWVGRRKLILHIFSLYLFYNPVV